MALTLRAVLAELDRLIDDGDRPMDEVARDEIVQSVARAALLGARGNSGVILSQLIRGAAEELSSRPGELIDPMLIGAALAHAADRAYASVRDPAEGTILTVAREMAHEIMTDVAHRTEDPRLGPDADPALQDEVIAATLERAVVAGQESVKRGPELLAALRDAGVVDAGGYALTILFAGVVAALRGDEPPELDHHAPARITHPEHHSSTFRFCTNFAVTGVDLLPSRFIPALEALGDSLLVVGDSTTLKVHLHTDEPERATAVFDGAGEVSRLDVADMRVQVAERDAHLLAANGTDAGGVVAAAPDGAGRAGNGRRAAMRCPRGRQRRRAARAVREPRRRHDRRRSDAQPVDLRAARRHPRRRGGGGRGAPEQRERDHGRRTRRGALREGRPRGSLHQSAGRALGRRRAATGVRRRRQRGRAHGGDGARAHRCGRRGRARRRPGALPSRRRGRLRRGGGRSRGARRERRSSRCSGVSPSTPS